MALTCCHGRRADRAALALGPARARHGQQPRDGQRHRHQHAKTDRLTFAIGCGIAGVAGAAFTTIGSTGPTSGSLYIVDAFLVVTFGGAASLLGTVARPSASRRRSHQRVLPAGSMAKVITLSLIVSS
jgi:branched-subunit amino acid ABC-type transport system permease component